MSKVSLRTKQLKGNRQRLYLDFYPAILHPDTGKLTRREFLKLFLYKKSYNENDRLHNKETKRIAENIRAKRQLEIQTGNYDFLAKYKGNESFLEWIKLKVAERAASKRNYQSWRSTYLHLYRFTKGTLFLKEVDAAFCERFRKYFLEAKCLNSIKPLHQNSAAGYFDVFKEAIREAHKENLLKKNVTEYVKSIPYQQPQREFLTYDELQAAVKIPCSDPVLKKAALFSALTGLRFSDILNLKWEELRQSDEHGNFLRKQIKKSGRFETMFISDQAYSILGESKEDQELVFAGLAYGNKTTTILKDWLVKAGVNRHITFHAFRHTYATLQITFGTDIYTLKDLLGQKDVKTTQIYARVIDERKKKAVDRIPRLQF